MACNECAFPICRTCYEYERREGSQVCPQCKTRFKRLKGCARVVGDEEEDDVDDLENEFSFGGKQHNLRNLAELKNDHMSYGWPGDMYLKLTAPSDHTLASHIPFLMDGRMVASSFSVSRKFEVCQTLFVPFRYAFCFQLFSYVFHQF